MSQILLSGEGTTNDNSFIHSRHASWLSSVPTSSIAALTSQLSNATWSAKIQSQPTNAVSSKPSRPFCRLCRRHNCQLKSHRFNTKPKFERHHQNYETGRVCDTKPKKVDDAAIRTAFTKSYAFSTPSCLSTLRPSCFRVDVFHDLPIQGGHRPEFHSMIWDFLTYRIDALQAGLKAMSMDLESFRELCLMEAMTNPAACLLLLVNEALMKEYSLGPSTPQNTAAFSEAYKNCLEQLRRLSSDSNMAPNLSERMTALCIGLVLNIQERPHRTKTSIPRNGTINTAIGSRKLITLTDSSP